MARFQAAEPNGVAVQQLEGLVRTAVFRSARDVVAYLLQQAADRVDAAYQPKPGWQRKARVQLTLDCIFGFFTLERDYYYHPGKQQGHYPADAALGLEGSCTPALARLVCLEGADEASYPKAQEHLKETGGIKVSARQIQRLVQGVGPEAQTWQEREALVPLPGTQPASIMYLSGDASGVPMRPEELEGRQGKGAEGKAKTRMANLGCVFTQHQVDDEGHPIRDPNSTTYVSTLGPLEEFGPLLRQEALRRGLSLATFVVMLIDGAEGLANLGRLCFPTALQIVDFYHAMEHARKVLAALLGSKEHPDFKKRLGRWARQLLRDKVQHLIEAARKECAGTARAEAVEKGTGLFRSQRGAHAVWHFPQPGFLHWFGSHRSRLQDDHRRSVQTVRHVLGCTGSAKHPGSSLPQRQPSTR